MESLKVLFRGLLLGVGFSVGALLIYICYQFFLEAPTRMEYQDKLISEFEVKLRDLSGEVIDFKPQGSFFRITSKIKNNGSRAQIYVAPKIEFLDASGRFLANCFGQPVQLLSGGNEAFFDMKCSISDPEKRKRVSSVRVLPIASAANYVP